MISTGMDAPPVGAHIRVDTPAVGSQKGLAQETMEKTCQKQINIIKKGAKINAKSIKNHTKIQFAFLGRFWGVLSEEAMTFELQRPN